MPAYRCISTQEAAALIEQGAQIADIRDQQSYQFGHITNARHLSNDNLDQFLTQSPRDTPMIVCCYHGNSSRPAAEYLASQGFADVYSLDGGYEAWRQDFPALCSV
ncbi:thiosulfate sulfurtransferase GlpE [Nitrincola alkalilacustris]|uniref:thiosulfate sulfurtransferase GlpE n=1 Tax=Nitrincola alkalilacustris TaxID=1571224 RepID=UPI00124CE4E7|nr:thiosulfate sulfurtransferase GlpE [Nitrincola alkalilacustris]